MINCFREKLFSLYIEPKLYKDRFEISTGKGVEALEKKRKISVNREVFARVSKSNGARTSDKAN